MPEAKEPLASPVDLVSAQVEKLRLEIVELKHKNKWGSRIGTYIPMLTAMIAVAGFVFGVLQYQSQANKDRATKEADRVISIEGQIRSNTHELLKFTSDPHQTLAEALLHVEDLNSLTRHRVVERTIDDIFPEYRQTITNSLVKMIHYDCNFIGSQRDVDITSIVIDHWADYSDFLKNNRVELEFLLYKYLMALNTLRERSPEYFESIEYDQSLGYKIGNTDIKETEKTESQFQHFKDLVIGFKEHFKLIPTEQSKEDHLKEFQSAVCNRRFTSQVFGKSFADQSACGL